ncbi:hypothetical protein [Campylobacter showae]|jgi:putative lipoprotein|uniref:hypothetical protein n=1 Tax=Campylobacter showae TaxID=204 RepID=UPI001F12A4FA|nr:hypothetical protein [Campylobacter showae]
MSLVFRLKFLNLATVLLVFSGCAFFEQKSPPKVVQKPVVQKPAPVKGSLRGVISSVTYDGGKYCYDIKSIDVSNGKLPSGKYCADKFYFSGGDTVYASVSGGLITEMLLIKSGTHYVTHKVNKTPKFKSTSPAKSPQQQESNKKILIEVPKSENISFD